MLIYREATKEVLLNNKQLINLLSQGDENIENTPQFIEQLVKEPVITKFNFKKQKKEVEQSFDMFSLANHKSDACFRVASREGSNRLRKGSTRDQP